MTRGARALTVGCLALASACSLPGGEGPRRFAAPDPAPDAFVAVEIYRGFAQRATPLRSAERVEVLIDVTPSMASRTAVGAARFVAAQQVTERLVRSLPEQSYVGLHALGVAKAAVCAPAFRTGHSGPGESRETLLREIEALRPAGEASLADAIEGLRVYLGATGNLARSRVVLLTDLGSECGGDLCEEVTQMIAGGARLELVLFGDGEVPGCLDDLDVSGAWLSGAAPPVTAFRVAPGRGGAAGGVEGVAGGEPVAVPAGAVRVSVDLDPPAEIGPLEVAPGGTLRLRILDFPALDPPIREVVMERDWSEARRVSGSDVDAGL